MWSRDISVPYNKSCNIKLHLKLNNKDRKKKDAIGLFNTNKMPNTEVQVQFKLEWKVERCTNQK